MFGYYIDHHLNVIYSIDHLRQKLSQTVEGKQLR